MTLGEMTQTTAELEARCREASEQFDRDVHIHFLRKVTAWTIAVGDGVGDIPAMGYGKTIEAAVASLRPADLEAIRRNRPRSRTSKG